MNMNRVLAFAYGAGSYVAFLLVFLYAVGFIGNLGVPTSLDAPVTDPLPKALAIDLGLLSLFALQHSVMARRGFKRLITRWIPPAVERSTYVLASSSALALLFWQWRPLGGVIWDFPQGLARGALLGGYVFGWLLVLYATFAINHFDLFGLRQVWRNLLGESQSKVAFVMPWLYRIVRHPLYVGWLFAFWSTPRMTVSHLFFAIVTSAYILVAIQLEERDLIREHPEYAAYRRRVPMLVPAWPRPAGNVTLAGREV